MDASFLIQSNAPAKGTKVTDQAAPETAKDDIAPGDASFGEVLGQVEGGPMAGTASDTQPQPAEAKIGETAADRSAEASAEGLAASLNLALAQQILALAPAQTNPDQADLSAWPGDVPAEGAGKLAAIAGSSVDSTTVFGLSAPRTSPDGVTPSALAPQEAMRQGEPAVGDHLTLTAQATQTSAPPSHEMTIEIADQKPALSLPGNPQAEQDQGGDQAEAIASPVAAAPLQRSSQEASKETGAPAGGSSQEAPATTALKTEVEHPAKAAPQPVAKPFAQTSAEDAGSQTGPSHEESDGQSQEASAQATAMLDHAPRPSTDVREGKPAGQDRKTSNAAGLPASERLPVNFGEAKAFRSDESVQIAAAAPVVPPAEPAGPAPVQALRLEVERPDIGQVALRVVLADQTVHAKVTTDHLEVRDFLVARQGQLESGLKANGLEMGEFRVDVNQHRHGQSESGWLGSYRDSWGQGRQPSGHQPGPQPDLAADRWPGDIEPAASGRSMRSLSVFA